MEDPLAQMSLLRRDLLVWQLAGVAESVGLFLVKHGCALWKDADEEDCLAAYVGDRYWKQASSFDEELAWERGLD